MKHWKRYLDRLVWVDWLDSSGTSAWRELKSYQEFAKGHNLSCESVGWVIQESADRVTISSTRSKGTDEVNGNQIIPRCAIVEIVEISG